MKSMPQYGTECNAVRPISLAEDTRRSPHLASAIVAREPERYSLRLIGETLWLCERGRYSGRQWLVCPVHTGEAG